MPVYVMFAASVSITDTAVIVARLEFVTVMMYEMGAPATGTTGRCDFVTVSDGWAGVSQNPGSMGVQTVAEQFVVACIHAVLDTKPLKQAAVVPTIQTVALWVGPTVTGPSQARMAGPPLKTMPVGEADWLTKVTFADGVSVIFRFVIVSVPVLVTNIL